MPNGAKYTWATKILNLTELNLSVSSWTNYIDFLFCDEGLLGVIFPSRWQSPSFCLIFTTFKKPNCLYIHLPFSTHATMRPKEFILFFSERLKHTSLLWDYKDSKWLFKKEISLFGKFHIMVSFPLTKLRICIGIKMELNHLKTSGIWIELCFYIQLNGRRWHTE